MLKRRLMMLTTTIGCALVMGIGCASQSTAEVVNGTNLFWKCDFTSEEMKDWTMPASTKVVEKDGGLVLEVTEKKFEGEEYPRAKIPFDYTKAAGKALRLEVEVACENLSKPNEAWNGAKAMMIFSTKTGQKAWHHADGQFGTHGWKKTVTKFNVPDDVLPGTLEVGIQNVTGTARFRNLKVYLEDAEVFFSKFTGAGYRCVYTDRVLNEPVRRGFMSRGSFSPDILTDDLPTLKSFGANLYRWQLIRNWGTQNSDQDVDDYLNWVRGKVQDTIKVLDRAQELGIRVILDLHVAPGGRGKGGHMNMFEQQKFADAYLESWKILATAVKGHPALFGYDLINEPSQPSKVVLNNYISLQYQAACLVRSIDPVTPVIFESNGWDAPYWFGDLRPLPLKDVIYQAHMYYPMDFTHQGVHGSAIGQAYPDDSKGYNREGLKKVLKPVRDFQLKYGARIYIGEFSAIRWAKGAENYLADCISIFEEYGWDWSYHAFREWDGWSCEHSSDPKDTSVAKEDTPRKKALLEGFKNNSRK